MRSGDLASGVALAALGGYVVTQAAQWDYLTADGPGPGFFPLWYGAALVALSLLLVVSSLVKRHKVQPGKPMDWGEVARALTGWAAFALCTALMQVLGFFVAFALMTFFVVCIMYGRPLKTGIAAGVLGAAAFYLVFPLALEVSLPAGLLGF